MGQTTVEEVLKLVEMVAELPGGREQDEQHETTDNGNNNRGSAGLSLEDLPDA